MNTYEVRFNFRGQAMQTTFINADSYQQATEQFEGQFPTATLGSIVCEGWSN
jgi:hypothetical protein